MKLFDLHCDTLSVIYAENSTLAENTFHLSLNKTKNYEAFSQIFAIWSRQNASDDENYNDFFSILNYAKKELVKNDTFTPYLAVEGGKLLGGDISRLDVLYEAGVRFFTLVWGDICCIGGAHNTDEGLTGFGKAVVRRCLELGIVPDVSHSSDKSFFDTLAIAKEYQKPIIATHSNSRAVCSHKRNLTDEIFTEIKNTGGIVGISLCRPHVAPDGNCDIDTVVNHIGHYLSIGGGDTVCLGCDLDGIDCPPEGLSNVGDLYKIGTRLSQKGISDIQIDKIFFDNANNFMIRNHIQPIEPQK